MPSQNTYPLPPEQQQRQKKPRADESAFEPGQYQRGRRNSLHHCLTHIFPVSRSTPCLWTGKEKKKECTERKGRSRVPLSADGLCGQWNEFVGAHFCCRRSRPDFTPARVSTARRTRHGDRITVTIRTDRAAPVLNRSASRRPHKHPLTLAVDTGLQSDRSICKKEKKKHEEPPFLSATPKPRDHEWRATVKTRS